MFHFFQTGPFSNWFSTNYTYKDHNFKNVEQGFAYEKAKFFEDDRIAEEILNTSNPITARELGRKVKGFNEKIWDKHRLKTMLEHVKQKFLQNQDVKKYLLQTPKQIVFANKSNRIWAIGSTDLRQPNKWGQNLLGRILTNLRETFIYHLSKITLKRIDHLAYNQYTTKLPVQTFEIKDGVDNWDEFVGSKINKQLSKLEIPINGTIVEIGPGSVSKVGHGLQQFGFKGKLILIEPEPQSLLVICDNYRNLIPNAEIIPCPMTLDCWLSHLTELEKFDLVIGNHVIDDILIGKYITRKEDINNGNNNLKEFFENHYEGADLATTSHYWELFTKDHASRIAIKTETLNELINISSRSKASIYSAYDSYSFRSHENLYPPLHHAHIFSRLLLKDLAEYLNDNYYSQIKLDPDEVIQDPSYWYIGKLKPLLIDLNS